MIVVGFSSWRALRDTTTTAKAGTTEDTEGHGERHGFLLQGR